MSSLVDVCRFNPVSAGTGDFVVSSAVTGYQTPAGAGATNGATYSYRAESADLSQWEVGEGAYTSGSTTLARTSVLYNSLGDTSKIDFSAAPQVAIVALAGDVLTVAGNLSNIASAATAFGNIKQAASTTATGVVELATDAETITGTDTTRAITPSNLTAAFGAWTAFTPTITAGSGTFTSVAGAGRYKQVGKTVNFTLKVTITTNGTAAGHIKSTLPVNASTAVSVVLMGGEGGSSTKAVMGFIAATNEVRLFFYDGTYPGGSGATPTISGVYEAA